MTLLTLDPDLRLAYAQDWNLNVERAFGKDWLFQIGYIGTKGTKLPRFIDANPGVYVPGASTQDNADQRRLYSGCTLQGSTPCTYSSVGEIVRCRPACASDLATACRCWLPTHFPRRSMMHRHSTLPARLRKVSREKTTDAESV
jgi:hypothetical protein